MLVLFLILFTNVLADSDEDKYVDLLPDSEKQQFIDNVARRILEDVEIKEHGNKFSGEISDEQLMEHNEYVKAILKQESENVRRSKAVDPKDKREYKQESEETDDLDVKPLERPDFEHDLTLRHDRRSLSFNVVSSQENSTDIIEEEIVTDNAPIIKRSVQNSTGSESSESEEFTTQAPKVFDSKTQASDKLELTTERWEVSKTIIESTDLLEASTEGSKLFDSTTKASELIESKLESSENVESNESKDEQYKSNHFRQVESTTIEYRNELLEQENPHSNESSEKDTKGIQAWSTEQLRPNYNSNESTDKKPESDLLNPGVEYAGTKSTENKSDESNIANSTDIEEFTTFTTPPENTTTKSVATRQTIDESTEQSAIYDSTQYTEKESDTTTENYNRSTLTSTMTDEGTTNLVIETTSYVPQSDFLLTHAESSTVTISTDVATESTINVVATTDAIVEELSSTPILDTRTDFGITTKSSTNTNDKKPKVKQRVQESITSEISSEEFTTTYTSDEETTTIEVSEEEATTKKNKIHIKQKINTSTKKSIKFHDVADEVHDDKAIQHIKEKRKHSVQVKDDKASKTADKNFIELEKVYYNKTSKTKGSKEYQVYEIPADVTPFVQKEDPITEQPYYVPIYNYSPNNAYFNPQNHLGPNADDDSQERVSPFIVNEDANIINLEKIMNDNEGSTNLEYSAFSHLRKKFSSKQTFAHSIHNKTQQNNSQEKKWGYGKVNPEDYLDSDYYFGRIRKDLERRLNQNNVDLFPNSDKNNHPVHSIQENNLKDHVSAVRNVLFQQKLFGLIHPSDPVSDSETEQNTKNKENRIIENDNQLVRNGQNLKKNHENIAIDYYFGRMKPQLTTVKSINKKNNEHLKKVGYVRTQNETKELYVIDKLLKEEVMKYVHELMSKNASYIKADLITATPLPKKKISDNSIKIFRYKEKQQNAEIIKYPTQIESKEYIMELVEKKNKMDSTKNDLSTAVKTNVSPALLKRQELNLKLHRRNDNVKISVYLEVLRDMTSVDNKALKQYDWLGTTVDIQASLQKLFELNALINEQEDIHPADMEILKYVVFLHKLAVEIREANDFSVQLRKKLALPRNKKKVKHLMLKEKGLLNRVWLYLRRQVPEVNENGALKNFNKFLMDLEDGLYDLHDAIKNIAKVTKYKKQHWFQNLKDLYLNTDEKHLSELLLHMSVSRLFGLIEESAKNGLEDDYVQYMKINKKEAKRTLEELLFVMQILDEINKSVE